jgi:hypothetical protein
MWVRHITEQVLSPWFCVENNYCIRASESSW